MKIKTTHINTKEKTMEQNYKIEEPELIKKETVKKVIFYIYIFFSCISIYKRYTYDVPSRNVVNTIGRTEYIVNRESNERYDKPFSSLSCYKTSDKDLEIGDKIGDFEFFDKDGKSLKVYKIYNSKYGVGIKKAKSFTVFNTELK